jgi:protein-disulfide isomerase
MMGDGDAPLTIVEWSDYQCTFCKRFRDQTLDQIKSQYIDTGKVKFVYRDFPLDSIHPNARPAAIASECAGDEGKFWEFHDKLFETQQQWSNSPSAKDLFKQYGTELGIDIADCIVGNMYDGEVSKDLADGSANGVSGTPAFIVGNQYLSGAQPFERFKAVIEAQLRE